MPTQTQIDKTLCKLLRTELDKVLPDISKKLGVSLKPGNASYGYSTGTFKIEMAQLNDSGIPVSKEALDYKNYASSYGLDPNWLNTDFTSNGSTYTITGLKTRSYKNPVLAKNKANGTVYKFTPETIKLYKGTFTKIPTLIQKTTTV